VTISSSLDHPEIWKALDFYQPHLYAADPAAEMAKATLPSDRPVFYGEFAGTGEKLNRTALRNALYTGLLANMGGTPMFWDWDRVVSDGLYPELATLAKVAKDSDIGHHPVATRLTLSVFGCTARGIGSSDWVLMRVIAGRSAPYNVQIGGLSVPEGPCSVEVIDLDSGQTTTTSMSLVGSKLIMELPGKDCAVIVKPA
jgi:hypothetical protein